MELKTSNQHDTNRQYLFFRIQRALQTLPHIRAQRRFNYLALEFAERIQHHARLFGIPHHKQRGLPLLQVIGDRLNRA